MEIYRRLAEIQRQLKAPKDLKNSFGGYTYRNAEAIKEAVKPLLNPELGECILTSNGIELIGDRYYVRSVATFTSGGEHVACSASAREPETKKGMDEAQITGAASSYADKRALGGLLGLDDSRDDPDTTNKHGADDRAEDAQEPPKVNVTLAKYVAQMAGMRDPAAVQALYEEAGQRNKSKDWYVTLGYYKDAMVDLLAVTDPAHVKDAGLRHKDVFAGDSEIEGWWQKAREAHWTRLRQPNA
jgi:hypothetical protein